MSLRDFWSNVRTAGRLIAPRAVADSPGLDAAGIEDLLRRATFWLTPKAVEGFDPNEFDFLPQDQRKALAEAVSRFRDIARQVPPDQPATKQQIQKALPDFLRIVEILRPDRYADPDALVLGKRVEQHLAGHLPAFVSELRFETGVDVGDAPALWIWVVLKDEAARKEVFESNVRTVRKLLEETVRNIGIQHWPYVRFRTVAELEPPLKKGRK